jgi:hypothetical protein
MIQDLWEKFRNHEVYNILMALLASLLANRFLNGRPFESYSNFFIFWHREFYYWKFIGPPVSG